MADAHHAPEPQSPAPKNDETDPPAANQPIADDHPDLATSAEPPTQFQGKPAPTPVPVPGSAGGQIRAGKPDGEVDTST